MLLKNKTAVVIGGTRGIGKAIVEEFSREGAQVIFTYLNNESMSQQIEEDAVRSGLKVKACKLDVRDFSVAQKFKENILQVYSCVVFGTSHL